MVLQDQIDPAYIAVGGDGTLYCGHGYEIFALDGSNGGRKWSHKNAFVINNPLSISPDGLLMVLTYTGYYSIGKRSASSAASWRKRYFYDDISPNSGINLKGRLSRALSRDESGEEIEEMCTSMIQYGRMSAVSLRAAAFDDLHQDNNISL